MRQMLCLGDFTNVELAVAQALIASIEAFFHQPDTFRHMDDPKMVVEGLLYSLRPPDREPPRLASLTAEQEAVIVGFLEQVAFSDDSANRDFAIQVLEEWWIPDALYRKH